MAVLDEEEEFLANFLESEILSEYEIPEHEETENLKLEEDAPKAKKQRVDGKADELASSSSSSSSSLKRIDTGDFSKIPSELFHRILIYLSSEDLVSCSLVCSFLNHVASDEYLWRRLYILRWGQLPPKRFRDCAWKKLYIKRDQEDMADFTKNCQPEFREYYIQMQVAKRSQSPLSSQVSDYDVIILDKTIADQISTYKTRRGLSDDDAFVDHVCCGKICTYFNVDNVFVCEKTGHVHVCDDTCKEVVFDIASGSYLVCTISGRCFESLVTPSENEMDLEDEEEDEKEPSLGSGRFARAYLLGYNCADEKELQATLKFC